MYILLTNCNVKSRDILYYLSVEKFNFSPKNQSTKMNTITSIFVAALCITGALASPIATSEVQQETRTIYNNDQGLSLGLNTTTLVIAGVAIAALALLIFVVLPQTGLLDDVSSSGYQQRYDQYYQQQEQPYRTKRSFNESKSIRLVQLNHVLAFVSTYFYS